MKHSATRTATAHNVRVDGFVAQMHQSERAAIARAIERQDVAELERAQIAARIKQARKEAGLSQPEMADAIGVIPRTYQNYESAKDPRTPWGLMNEIAKVTGKSTEWLIHGGHATPDLMAGETGNERDERLERIEAELSAVRGLLQALAIKLEADVPPPPPGELGHRLRAVEPNAEDRETPANPREGDAPRSSGGA